MAQCTECAALQQRIDRFEQEKDGLIQQMQQILLSQRQSLEWMQQIDNQVAKNQLITDQLQLINHTLESSMTDSSDESSMSADLSPAYSGPPTEFPAVLKQQLIGLANQAMALAFKVDTNHLKFVTYARTAPLQQRWQKTYSAFIEVLAGIDNVAGMEDLSDSENQIGTPQRSSPVLYKIPGTGASNPAVTSRWIRKPAEANFANDDDAFYDSGQQIGAGLDQDFELRNKLGWHTPKPDSPTQS